MKRLQNASGVARRVTGGSGDELQDQKHRHRRQSHLPIEHFAHEAIAHVQDLRHPPGNKPHQKPLGDGLNCSSPSRHRLEVCSQPQQQFDKSCGHHSAQNTEDGIETELERVNQLVLREVKERLVTEHQAQDHPRGGRPSLTSARADHP